jgi:hypothetical protein
LPLAISWFFARERKEWSESGTPQSPVFCKAKNAPEFRIETKFINGVWNGFTWLILKQKPGFREMLSLRFTVGVRYS